MSSWYEKYKAEDNDEAQQDEAEDEYDESWYDDDDGAGQSVRSTSATMTGSRGRGQALASTSRAMLGWLTITSKSSKTSTTMKTASVGGRILTTNGGGVSPQVESGPTRRAKWVSFKTT